MEIAGNRRSRITLPVTTVAEGYLALLKQRGIKYFFANAGTDFPPIVEAFARSRHVNIDMPTPITVPHENAAVGMAFGYYLMTGEPQAVMVHVNVGTANALGGLINASRENIPMMLVAGKNPVSEKGPHGTRTAYIQWPQEAFDQGGIVREYIKWEYELRQETEIETFVDRAIQIMLSDPTGPVYQMLPREALARSIKGLQVSERSSLSPAAPPAPDPSALKRSVQMIAAAEYPVVLVNTIGREPAAVDALITLAETYAMPVVQPVPRYMNFPDSHPMHFGYAVDDSLRDADLMLLIDCDVPWIPSRQAPRRECQFINLGIDPAFASLPLRGFPADITLQTAASTGLQALHEELSAISRADSTFSQRVESRRKKLFDRRQEVQGSLKGPLPLGSTGRINPAWATAEIFAACGQDAVYFSEYPLQRSFMDLVNKRSFFSQPPAGALGWGFGAALGAKLAAPEKLVVAALGDGAYFFNNPAVGHFLSQANTLPLLVLVFNNERWQAVRGATLNMYPDGAAASMNDDVPLSGLKPSPAFEMYVEASGGLGARVSTPEELRLALQKAIVTVRNGRQALINIQT